MPLFTELEGEWSFMIQFMFKIVYLSLAVLNLYRCCIIWFRNSTVFNVKVKNFAFVTSKVIRNAWFYEELVTCMLCQKKLNICINKTLLYNRKWFCLFISSPTRLVLLKKLLWRLHMYTTMADMWHVFGLRGCWRCFKVCKQCFVVHINLFLSVLSK